jgi:uncharacterized repeat protein (TIGR01451 family)
MNKKWSVLGITVVLVILCFVATGPEPVNATSYDGNDLAVALLANQSTLISSSYVDKDTVGHREVVVLTSRGNLLPTDGSSFILLSTGRADLVVATTDGLNPGSERGNWFQGGQYGNPRDEATLTLQLRVPAFMHYLYYDVQFFTVEYPDYIGTQYNDQLTISVNSPSKGVSTYVINVNGGDFVLNARDTPLMGTGYDLFATSGNPDNVDWLTTTPNPTGADAGATALIGRQHPVSPNEIITITFDIKDQGDNQFDSMAFLDNLRFSGFAKTQMLARKSVQDINGDFVQCADILEYDITLSNIGTANQTDNPGHEFEDPIPVNAQYVSGSTTAGAGIISYDSGTNKIVWDGSIPAQSSVALSFKVKINTGLMNGTKVSNQGIVYWDENEDGLNEKIELTDDPAVNDGIDQDGDGETGDDDPTVVSVWSYQAPTTLTEDFAGFEDIVYGAAQDSYEGVVWFTTSALSGESNFEVSPSYHFITARSFKTKLRSVTPHQYWNYSFSMFNSHIVSWEVWFTCGNSSEAADLYIDFKTSGGNSIALVKLEYVHVDDAVLSSAYQVKLSYKTPTGWEQLRSNHPNGYLYNGWYKLRIENYRDTAMNYSLTQKGAGITDAALGQPGLGAPFSSLTRIEWYSLHNPVVYPIVFWDEHTVCLVSNS